MTGYSSLLRQLGRQPRCTYVTSSSGISTWTVWNKQNTNHRHLDSLFNRLLRLVTKEIFIKSSALLALCDGFSSQRASNTEIRRYFHWHDVTLTQIINCVSNHQPHHFYSTVYSGADQGKHQSSASLAIAPVMTSFYWNEYHSQHLVSIIFWIFNAFENDFNTMMPPSYVLYAWQWFRACLARRQYFNQCRIVNRVRTDKRPWKFYSKSVYFLSGNSFENVVYKFSTIFWASMC